MHGLAMRWGGHGRAVGHYSPTDAPPPGPAPIITSPWGGGRRNLITSSSDKTITVYIT